MKYTVIAISRTLGAGGEDLGEALARELGFRYVDAEIIQKASEAAGVSSDTLGKVEARKGLIGGILENMSRANTGGLYGAAEIPMIVPSEEPHWEQLIVDVIKETAAEGNVVIVAHGASIPLAGHPGLPRGMVTAPEETRTARLPKSDSIIVREPARKVADSDRARADYFRRFYKLDHETPENYDLTFNTEVVGIDQARAAILAIVRP